MPRTGSRSIWIALSGAAALYATSFSMVAQTTTAPPAAAPIATLPQAGAPPAEGQPPDAGRGRGRGGRGGPNETDPANADADFTKRDPVLPLPPAEQAKQFILQPGYRLEPVLADPAIEEPTAIAFDGNGRMFVLEIRGYMQDADATGERDPWAASRCTRIATTTASTRSTRVRRQAGVPAVRHAVRRQRILTMETERRRGVEVHGHEQRRRRGQEGVLRRRASAGPATSSTSRRSCPGRWTTGCTAPSTRSACAGRRTACARADRVNGAQWGVTQDNDGKMWFQGGASGMPVVLPVPDRSTASSTFPISSSRTCDIRGARRCASPTCRAGCRRSHARRHAQPRDRRRGQRRLSRRSPAG